MRALRTARIPAGPRRNRLDALPLAIAQDAEEVGRERLALLAPWEMGSARSRDVVRAMLGRASQVSFARTSSSNKGRAQVACVGRLLSAPRSPIESAMT